MAYQNKYFGQSSSGSTDEILNALLSLGISQHELAQVGNIGGLVISPANWSSVSTLDQSLSTTSNVLFNSVISTSNVVANGLISTKVDIGPHWFLFNKTLNKVRWLYATGVAETGGNSGSDLYLSCANDAGTTLHTPLYIIRSSGYVGIGTSLVPTSTLEVGGTGVLSPIFKIKDGAFKSTIQATTAHLSADRTLWLPDYDQDLTYPVFSYMTTNIGTGPHWSLKTSNNIYRWQVGMYDVEAGTNTGSNFAIKLYLDNSTLIDALNINRATGYVGIGTPSPTQALHITGNVKYTGELQKTVADGSTANACMNFKNSSDYGIYTEIGDKSGRGATLTFKSRDYNGGANDIRNVVHIEPTGNVGIGTTAPSFPFEVSGNMNCKNAIFNTGINPVVIDANYRAVYIDINTGQLVRAPT